MKVALCIYYDIVLYNVVALLSKVPTYEGTVCTKVRRYESTSTKVLFKFDL